MTNFLDIQSWKPHPLAYFFYYLGGIAITLLSLLQFNFGFRGVFLGFLIFVITEFIRRSETFSLTDKGLAREFRFVSTATTFAEYSKIQDVSVEQSFFDRIFDIGNVSINTAGSPGPEILFRGVKNPQKVANLIKERLHY